MSRKERDPIHVEYYRIRCHVRSIWCKQRVRRYAGNRRTKEDIESCFFAARPSTGDRPRPLYSRRQLVRRWRYSDCARNSHGSAGQRGNGRSGVNTAQAFHLAEVVKDYVIIPLRSTRTTAGVPPDRYCCEQLTLTESRPTLTRDYFCVIAWKHLYFYLTYLQLHQGWCRFCIWGNMVGLTRERSRPVA